MPFKSEKIKIEGTEFDRRKKLTEADREKIKKLHAEGEGIRALGRMFNVDKRLIQFILFPERHEKNLKDRKERGGSKIYCGRKREVS